MEGYLTAENFIVGSTNLITEITSLQGRLDIEEPKTTSLQILNATHTTDIASLDTRLDTEEPKTTALQTLTATHTTDIASNTAQKELKVFRFDFASISTYTGSFAGTLNDSKLSVQTQDILPVYLKQFHQKF